MTVCSLASHAVVGLTMDSMKMERSCEQITSIQEAWIENISTITKTKQTLYLCWRCEKFCVFPSRQSFHLFLPVCCRDLEYPQGPSASCHVSFQEDLPLLPAGLCSGQEERREEADAKAWLCQKETNTKQQLPTLPEQLSNCPPWQAFFYTDPRFHFYCSILSVHTILIDFLFRKFILKISDLLIMDCEES